MSLAVRATFGFQNPNAAGALLAMLALAFWLIPGKGRLPLILRLAASLLCLAMLSLTASRGALVALLAGGLAWWVAAACPIPWTRWRTLLVLALVMIALLVVPGKLGHRMIASSPEEGSLSSRLVVYESIPRLMALAPGGWGIGQSASAYENWFQPLDDSRHYKNLLSTHGTWLVEFGWIGGFFYIIAWLLVILATWRNPVSFGIWVAWGMACMFSHLGKEWILWIVPFAALVMAICQSPDGRKLPSRAAMLTIAGAAFGLIFLMVAFGIFKNSIHKEGGMLVFGNGGEMIYCQPDESVLGTTWGKDLRSMGGVTVVMDWDTLKHTEGKKIIFSGNPKIPTELRLEDATLFLVNPPEKLNDAQRQLMLSAKKRVVFWGELRSDANPYLLHCWANDSGIDWIDLRGCGFFVPASRVLIECNKLRAR